MRTVSFSNRRVQDALNRHFVCCYSNTNGDPSSGSSIPHAPSDPPGACGRGAGRQNVQTFFLTPQNEIFHVASGFLSPEDLLAEIRFAQELFQEMSSSGKRPEELVVASHVQRLKKQGFSDKEISAGDHRFSDLLLSMPNPQDMGFNFGDMFGAPGRSNRGGMFGDIARKRTLKDHQFVIRHPLLKRPSFERNPQSLVGHHKSFFGSVGGPHTQIR